MKPKLVADTRNTLGESCFWDPRDNCLWWTDISESKIYRMGTDQKVTDLDLPDRACFILPRKKTGFVIGFPKKVVLADQSLSHFTQVEEIEASQEQTRINDAAVDPFGGVVFGTMHDPENAEDRRPLANLYRLAPDGALKKLLSDVVISNGLEFSPDGQIMYFADSYDGRIRRYSITSDFEEIHELTPLAEKFAAPGKPDGGCVDSHGNYWSARVWGGCVVRFSPDGKITAKHELPTRGPTCVTIGGASNQEVFITTLRIRLDQAELEAYPHAGGIFSVRTDIPALQQRLCLL